MRSPPPSPDAAALHSFALLSETLRRPRGRLGRDPYRRPGWLGRVRAPEAAGCGGRRIRRPPAAEAACFGGRSPRPPPGPGSRGRGGQVVRMIITEQGAWWEIL